MKKMIMVLTSLALVASVNAFAKSGTVSTEKRKPNQATGEVGGAWSLAAEESSPVYCRVEQHNGKAQSSLHMDVPYNSQEGTALYQGESHYLKKHFIKVARDAKGLMEVSINNGKTIASSNGQKEVSLSFQAAEFKYIRLNCKDTTK